MYEISAKSSSISLTKALMLSTAMALSLSSVALANGQEDVDGATVSVEEYQALKSEIEIMRAEIAEMKKLIKEQQKTAPAKSAVNNVVPINSGSQARTVSTTAQEPQVTKEEFQKLKKQVRKIDKTAKSAEEWKNTNSTVHLSGYASAGYASNDGGDGRFNQAQFAPIFHYQYKDRVLLEAELEFEAGEDGSTEIGMEYLTIDLLLNDYVTLIAGKFLSPVGQFRQNGHPSWINKLPSAPSGFGHDGAAPSAEMGLQLRGAIPMGDSDMRANYAVYVGNGPELETITVGTETEIHGISSEGFAADENNGKVVGGRVGFIPVPKLEMGVSGATGDIAIMGEDNRSYNVLGADFTYQVDKFDFRGEYIQQEVGSLVGSIVPDAWKTSTWYVQGSRKLPNNFEGVVRYSDFDSPDPDQAQKQWAIGLNYLFAPQVIAKIAYEVNDGLNGAANDENRWMAQLAYGF